MRKHRRGNGESKKTKGKSRRNKAEKPGIGLVQSFHARNVPRDRLTLKPREKLGIFNKGRASSPVRGRGLPDLVFSEMKFLQKRKDALEEAKPDSQRKRRRKDTTRANQEEISAYFTTMRPALAEKDGNVRSNVSPSRHKRTLAPRCENKQQKSPSADSGRPTIELPEKPYLGFGSRGTQHESTSCLSWSSSVRQPSETPVLQRALTTIAVGQLETVQARRHGANVNINRLPSAKSDARRRRGEAVEDDCNRRPRSPLRPVSRGKIFAQNPRSQIRSPQKRISSDNNEIKGLKPQEAGSSSNSPLRREARRLQYQHPKVQSDDNATSVAARSSQLQPSSYDHTSSVKEESEAQTSSTLSKLLRECDSAFAKDRKWELTQQYAGETWTGKCALTDNGASVGRDMENYQEAVPLPAFASQQSRPLMPGHPVRYHEQAPGSDRAEHIRIYSGNIEGTKSNIRTDGDDILLGVYEGAIPQAPDDRLSVGLRLSDPADGLGFMDADEQEQRDDERGDDGVFTGFWRPHKLY